MEQKVKKIMAKAFGVSIDEIKDDSSPHTIPAWDSLRHIDLVLGLEKEFGIKFDDEEIPTLLNYRMIVNTIQSRE